MATRTSLAAALQRWTYLVPLGVAVLIGLATWQHWTYFMGMALLALGPAVLGCADPVGELIDYIGREQRRREERRHRRQTVEQHAVGFLRHLADQSAEELRLMGQCVIRGRNGFNRAENDPVVEKLLARGLAYPEPGYTPAGYPYYFTDRAWVLMTELSDEVFAAHDRIGSPPITPPPTVKPRFHPLIFLFDLAFWCIKGPVLLAVVISAAGFAWFAWVTVLGTVIFIMVSAGYGIRWLLGW